MNAIQVTQYEYQSKVDAEPDLNFVASHLRRGSAMTCTIVDDGSVSIVHGEGGGCTLTISGNVKAILVPVRGSLQTYTPSLASALNAGEALVTDDEMRLKVVGNMWAQWAAVLGGRQAWTRILHMMQVGQALAPQILPALHVAERELRHHVVDLLRAADEPPLLERALRALVDSVISMQAPMHDEISRCPGRTHAKRLDAFLRLQRARLFIRSCYEQELDTETLARVANYSPCHFVRAFNQAFNETPHAFLLNVRLKRAWKLLHGSELAVTEVAKASGFNNRSAFSRLFHQRFGHTANDVRRLSRNDNFELSMDTTRILKICNV